MRENHVGLVCHKTAMPEPPGVYGKVEISTVRSDSEGLLSHSVELQEHGCFYSRLVKDLRLSAV